MYYPFLATYERDVASGLDYANARMYNSGRGRFMQADPIGLKGADLRQPQSLNRYSYVWNDPINHIDPTGELPSTPGWAIFLFECHAEVVSDGEGGLRRTGRMVCSGSLWGGSTNENRLEAEAARQQAKGTCSFPGFAALSNEQKALLKSVPGGNGEEFYNNLKPLEKAGFLNMTGALAALGISTNGLTLGTVQQDRITFKPGQALNDFISTMKARPDFSPARPWSREHPGMDREGGRQNRSFTSLQWGAGDEGGFVDIDLGNPQGGLIPFLVHGAEYLNPGATDPLKVGKKLGSAVVSYSCSNWR